VKSIGYGYSNGKKYKIYAVKDDNIGLCEIEGLIFLCWCTFEDIKITKKR
jgi:hypothetical protein